MSPKILHVIYTVTAYIIIRKAGTYNVPDY